MHKVLICPLNWGLGHAARCIPIAHEFLRQGYSVDFASDGGPLDLLRMEFPESRHFELPGYGITYPTNNMLINVGRKLLTFLSAIKTEKSAINHIVKDGEYDIVLSDNRFGCYSSHSFNIFLSHQINIATPKGFLDPAVNTFNHHFIRKYDECWIPDFPEYPGLSGKLGHNHTISNFRYIGPVSRFSKRERPVKYGLTAILSGPEPQRTNLENKLRKQLPDLAFPTALISGVVSKDTNPKPANNMKHFPYLPSNQLNDVLLESEMILCRGGYSTVMDLVAIGKKAICVPTPGQTEQEYLTSLYEEKGYFLRQKQDELNVEAALQKLDEYSGIPMKIDQSMLTSAVQDLEVKS